jgi:hypothetical protein
MVEAAEVMEVVGAKARWEDKLQRRNEGLWELSACTFRCPGRVLLAPLPGFWRRCEDVKMV